MYLSYPEFQRLLKELSVKPQVRTTLLATEVLVVRPKEAVDLTWGDRKLTANIP
jgi:hypothetical protein